MGKSIKNENFFDESVPRLWTKFFEVFKEKIRSWKNGIWLGAVSNRRLNDKIREERVERIFFIVSMVSQLILSLLNKRF
jgi:hypothetical protein